ncbi:MAG: ribokinase [Limnochordaceae bacterium]|nr:ribokinase [Limnochordaceae bacterium]
MPQPPRILVVGTSNTDLVTRIPRMPRMGETLIGHRFHMGCGGKGANQAVMAARLGAQVTMVTKLGRDTFGQITIDNYRKHGVDTRYVFWDDEASSGVATIFVDDEGHNLIAIVPGASYRLTPAEVRQAEPAIAGSDVVVGGFEVPVEVTAEALRLARRHGRTTILNPAPALPMPDELFELSDVLAPNEGEAETLSGVAIHDPESARDAARRLLERGARAVVITMGERGALLCEAGEAAQFFPAFPVKAVDTTGAGDAFIGALAARIGMGEPLAQAVVFANAAAALSVTRMGTQVSFPALQEVEDLLPQAPQARRL